MSVLLWTVAALAAGLLAILIATRVALKSRPPLTLPPGERLPSTPLQRLARACLALGSLFAAAAAAVVVRVGPKTFYDDDRVRLFVTALMLASIAVLGFFGARVGQWLARGETVLDERDREIFGRAPAAQSLAVVVTLAVWIVALQETFLGTRLVPMVYLYLVFWSCVIVNLLALPIGVLLGYRRN
jgi:hypothetical protein